MKLSLQLAILGDTVFRLLYTYLCTDIYPKYEWLICRAGDKADFHTDTGQNLVTLSTWILFQASCNTSIEVSGKSWSVRFTHPGRISSAKEAARKRRIKTLQSESHMWAQIRSVILWQFGGKQNYLDQSINTFHRHSYSPECSHVSINLFLLLHDISRTVSGEGSFCPT